MSPRPNYRTFDDFTREEIRPGQRASWSIDDVTDPNKQEQDFDYDPFEAMLDAASEAVDDDD